MSALDNYEVNNTNAATAKLESNEGTEEIELGKFLNKSTTASTGRKGKRVICFTDGSTMEDPADDDDDDDDNNDSSSCMQQPEDIEAAVSKTSSAGATVETKPPIDPKKLSWPEWVKYYSHKSGSNVVWGMESAGETLAYYLGITTPKYQHEIDEYNRLVAKKQKEEAEAKAWASTNPSSVPIVTDPVKSD